MKRSNAMFQVLLPSLFLALRCSRGARLSIRQLKAAGAIRSVTVALAGAVCTQDNRAVKEYFSVIDNARREHPELVKALTKFPKGADIHNHLSGTVMPEDYIALGSAEGDCFGPLPNDAEHLHDLRFRCRRRLPCRFQTIGAGKRRGAATPSRVPFHVPIQR